jgi:hypothetical protein
MNHDVKPRFSVLSDVVQETGYAAIVEDSPCIQHIQVPSISLAPSDHLQEVGMNAMYIVMACKS